MSLNVNEWPRGVVDKMDPRVIAAAQEVREVSGVKLVPSPDPEAHVRYKDGTSRHDIGANGLTRLSDGTDLFLVNNADAPLLWLAVQRVEAVGGFGIYFDTQLSGAKRVLIHIDTRPSRLLWVCPGRDRATERRSYVYFNPENPGPYLDLLSLEFNRL